MKMNKLIVAEVVLVIAGVFVFRGLWMLLDKVTFMHGTPALWLSLILGGIVTVWAVRCISKQADKIRP